MKLTLKYIPTYISFILGLLLAWINLSQLKINLGKYLGILKFSLENLMKKYTVNK